MDGGAMIGAGAASGLAGGLIGYFAQMDAMDRMEALQNRALQEFIGINVPDPKQQELALKQFISTGTFTPQLEKAISQQPSEFSKIIQDSKAKTAQYRALDQLSQIGSQGGLRLQDKAALQDAQMEGQVRDRGARDAILADSAQRGQGGGSGFALQAALQGQQASGDRDAKSALSVAASAQDRALDAIMKSGQLGGEISKQGFDQQAQAAQAQDAINRFNAGNLQGVQHSNVGVQNQGQQYNLDRSQQLSNDNTKQSNFQQQYNKELLQKNFDNKMDLAKAKAGVLTGQAQTAGQRGQATANLWGGIGQAGQGAATAAANQSYWDDYFNKKK